MIARPLILIAVLSVFGGTAMLSAGEATRTNTELAVPRPHSAGVSATGRQAPLAPSGYRWHDGQWWYRAENSDWMYWADKRWNAVAPATDAPALDNVQTDYLDSKFSRRSGADSNAARDRSDYSSRRSTGYRSSLPLYDRRYAHMPYYDRDLGGPYRGYGFGYPYRDVGYGIGGYYGALADEGGYPTYGYGFGYPGYGTSYRGGYFDTGTVVGAPPASDRMRDSGFGGTFGRDR
jgi:hypothetical protein